MDSLTHLAFGAALVAALTPAKHRRAALLAGAALNSLPDLDLPPLYLFSDDPVVHMTWHRAATHSLLVLPLVAIALWWLLKSRWTPVREAPRRWFVAIMLGLATHPLLDACTVYGTQLFWPLPMHPLMWANLFIFDPVFSVWLLVAVVVAWFARERVAGQRWLVAGLSLSLLYLGWSFVAKWQVERVFAQTLAAEGLAGAPHLSVPTPFNTVAWRLLVLTPGGYQEGFYSLLRPDQPIELRQYPSDAAAMAQVADFPQVRRLRWFASDFVKVQAVGDRLVLSDLRMGSEPGYFFRFVVARQSGGRWISVPTGSPDGGTDWRAAVARLQRQFFGRH